MSLEVKIDLENRSVWLDGEGVNLNENFVEASVRKESDNEVAVIIHYARQKIKVDFHERDAENVYLVLKERGFVEKYLVSPSYESEVPGNFVPCFSIVGDIKAEVRN